MTDKIFARNLKHLMKIHKVTTVQLAEKLMIKESRVRSWKEGRSYPRTTVLVDLMELLNFHDFYAMMTVDISKHRKVKKEKLPVETQVKLKEINNMLKSVLEE